MRGTAVFDVKDEHLNEAHIVDILSNEYSLEEILYQLARILFSQSLSQGISHFALFFIFFLNDANIFLLIWTQLVTQKQKKH